MTHCFKNALIAFIIVNASTRGLFVYHFNFSPELTYSVSGLGLAMLGMYATWRVWRLRLFPELVFLRKLIQINFFILVAHSVLNIAFGGFTLTDVYIILVFPVSILMLTYPLKTSETIILLVSIVTIMGIFIVQSLALTDINQVYEIQSKLRPAEDSIPHINGIAQIGGYQASNHDASAILAMVCIFALVYVRTATKKNRYVWFFIFITGTIALFLTGAATNISVFLFFSILTILLSINNVFKLLPVALLFALIVSYLYTINSTYFDLFLFIKKFEGQHLQESGGMLNGLDYLSIIHSIPSLLFGFGHVANAPMVNSEVALVKMIVNLGCVPAIVLYLVLISPLMFIRRARVQRRRLLRALRRTNLAPRIDIIHSYRDLVLHALPVLTGVFTLLHYGSLLRVTSIGVWCVLLGIFLRQYIKFSRNYKSH